MTIESDLGRARHLSHLGYRAFGAIEAAGQTTLQQAVISMEYLGNSIAAWNAMRGHYQADAVATSAALAAAGITGTPAQINSRVSAIEAADADFAAKLVPLLSGISALDTINTATRKFRVLDLGPQALQSIGALRAALAVLDGDQSPVPVE